MYMSNPTPCVSYLRVSDRGQENGDGFPRQRIAIEKYAAANGYKIEGEYRDVQTGKDEWQSREGWTAMLKALNGTRTILVEGLHRVARHVLVQELIMVDLRKKDIALITSSGDDSTDDAPERVMFRQLLGVFSQFERTTIVLKLRGARERMKAETGRCEGRKPYGHYPGEAENLEHMRWWRGTGATFQSVADAMNAAGKMTRSGKPWGAATVCKILGRHV